MKMFRTGTMILIMILGIVFLSSACAEEGTRPLIQDDADLLTEQQEKALYEDMLSLCEYGTPMFWTTTEPGDCRSLAVRYYQRTLGNGRDGVLFVIDMNVRELVLVADGAVRRTVTGGEAETITDNVFRKASAGDYYACASDAFSQVLRLLRGEAIARPMKMVSSALLGLALALLAVYLYLSFRYENRPKTGAAKAALPVTAVAAAAFTAKMTNSQKRMTKQKKTNIRSDSGSSGHGGGFSGGHSGGGFSGSVGSHKF